MKILITFFCSSLEWTDPKPSAPLYTLFLGNGSKILDHRTSPVTARVGQKLFEHLLKCRGNGISTSKGMLVIIEALFGKNTNQTYKVLALQFAEKLITKWVVFLFCNTYFKDKHNILCFFFFFAVGNRNWSTRCLKSYWRKSPRSLAHRRKRWTKFKKQPTML